MNTEGKVDGGARNDSFPYRHLQPGHIRLLKLRPSNALRFDLISVPLESDQEFAALSYTWGTSELHHEISVNGRPFFVGESLYLALKQLQSGVFMKKKLKRPLERHAFWIDAICINQSKNATAERNTQVKMMAKIYMRAQKVYVWLGPANNISQNRAAAATLQALERRAVGAELTCDGRTPVWWPSIDRHRDGVEIQSRLNHKVAQHEINTWLAPNHSTPKAWQGIKHIWSSPWWTRAWAHQEATMYEKSSHWRSGMKSQKTKIRFVSGEMLVTGAELITADSVVDSLIRTKMPGTQMLDGATSAFRKVWHIRILRHSSPPHTLATLSNFRLASCKDPRDKVYATLGISSDSDQINPDYDISVIELYTDLAKRWLESNRALDFLGHAFDVGDPNRIAKRKGIDSGRLPSWVPNWDVKVDIRALPKALLYLSEYGPDSQRPMDRYHGSSLMIRRDENSGKPVRTYNACGMFLRHDGIVHGSCLTISGVCVDTIRALVQNTAEDRSARIAEWQANASKSRYPTSDEFNAARRKVHCADVKWAGVSRPYPESRGYSVDDEALHRNREDPDDWKRGKERDRKQSMALATRGRAVCFTYAARLGLVPDTSRIGDTVCMLYGGSVLYVLRRNARPDATYKFIGEAYVHGLMDGEVNELIDAEGFPIEQFIIT